MSIPIPKKYKDNLNINTNTPKNRIQTQSQDNTQVSRYFAISSQYPKNSSKYCASMDFSGGMKSMCSLSASSERFSDHCLQS